MECRVCGVFSSIQFRAWDLSVATSELERGEIPPDVSHSADSSLCSSFGPLAPDIQRYVQQGVWCSERGPPKHLPLGTGMGNQSVGRASDDPDCQCLAWLPLYDAGMHRPAAVDPFRAL